jgi:site-specific DNA-cytosine methylase
MNVLSLFDGMSCGQIALERAGIKVDNYYASEIDKYAMQVSKANYPNTQYIGSVVDVKASELPKIDLLIGGSPCQGFSFAGKQLNFDDPRSKLFFEYVRLLNECNPKYFLLENVRMKKEFQDVISSYLGVEPIMINSSLVSAQNRARLYWTNIPNIIQPEDKNVLFSDILEDIAFRNIPNCFYGWWGTSQRINKGLNSLTKAKANCLTTKSTHLSQYILNEDKTLCRLPTVNECERLQTVPDNYTSGVSNTQRYKMLGNGWTVDVITHILKNIKEIDDK